MTLRNPLAIYIGIPAVALFCAVLLFYTIRKGQEYRGGIRAANTSLLRNLPEYKRLIMRYRVLTVLLCASLITGMIACVVLLARPSKTQTITSGVKKRDIFLCLDVSYSIYELNYDLVDTLEEVVAGLEGDRFGVSIYNTSTVLYVPMTDDYDFVISRLEELKEYFSLQKQYMEQFGDYEYISDIPEEERDLYYELDEKTNYMEAGTLTNNRRKGSSLIGEGLASCLFNFPHLDDSKRTRIIIMATDNDQQAIANPIVQLSEAADLCRGHDVTVFGLFPGKEQFDTDQAEGDYDKCLEDMKVNIEKTGGVFYVAGTGLSVPEIVKDIQQQEAMAVNSVKITRLTDQPQTPMLVLLISMLCSGVCALLLKM